jgi:hypothetical protein
MSDATYILGGHRRMTRSDVQGGRVTYDGATIAATVGAFEQEDPLMTGGHAPRTMGTVEIADCDLPDGVDFASDAPITVTDGAGNIRSCKIVSWKSGVPIWQLTVHDLNQG